jgi:hypothetical protein
MSPGREGMLDQAGAELQHLLPIPFDLGLQPVVVANAQRDRAVAGVEDRIDPGAGIYCSGRG